MNASNTVISGFAHSHWVVVNIGSFSAHETVRTYQTIIDVIQIRCVVRVVSCGAWEFTEGNGTGWACMATLAHKTRFKGSLAIVRANHTYIAGDTVRFLIKRS